MEKFRKNKFKSEIIRRKSKEWIKKCKCLKILKLKEYNLYYLKIKLMIENQDNLLMILKFIKDLWNKEGEVLHILKKSFNLVTIMLIIKTLQNEPINS